MRRLQPTTSHLFPEWSVYRRYSSARRVLTTLLETPLTHSKLVTLQLLDGKFSRIFFCGLQLKRKANNSGHLRRWHTSLLKADVHIIKGGCTHNCEIFAEILLNGGVNSREFFCGMWLITSVKKLSRTLSGAKGPAKLLVVESRQ